MIFEKEFIWGVASSAYQIEGASTHEGKGVSIWDEFSKKKGKISRNHNADEACNFYHRYSEDLNLMNRNYSAPKLAIFLKT